MCKIYFYFLYKRLCYNGVIVILFIMNRNKKYLPCEVHFSLAIFSISAIFLFLLNQYLNNNLNSYNYINFIIVILLVLVTIFHIFEGIKNRDKNNPS